MLRQGLFSSLAVLLNHLVLVATNSYQAGLNASWNCSTPSNQCVNFGTCVEDSGRCKCPAGFEGDDCSQYSKLPIICHRNKPKKLQGPVMHTREAIVIRCTGMQILHRKLRRDMLAISELLTWFRFSL